MSLQKEIKSKWKPRSKSAHKGDFGRIAVIAGAEGYAGAAHLAGMGALRTGAGLVTLCVPRKVYSVLAKRETEVMVKPFPSTSGGSFSYRAYSSLLSFVKTQDVLAIGPGLSRNAETGKLIRHLLDKTKQPIVLDADGLIALKRCEGCLKRNASRMIMTPHPGEFRALFSKTLMNEYVKRKKAVSSVINKYGMTMVLKGNETLVGQSKKSIYRNRTGNPGMATGGSGDVLTGMIAALLGQGFDMWDAARFGVYLHGLAGDAAAKEKGEVSLVASDILENLPKVIKRVRGE